MLNNLRTLISKIMDGGSPADVATILSDNTGIAPEPPTAFIEIDELNLSDQVKADFVSARHWLEASSQSIVADWAVSEARRYDVDQDDQSICFHFDDGWRLEGKIQILFSFDPYERSVLWGWANPHLNDQITQVSLLIRDYGMQNAIPEFTLPNAPLKPAICLVPCSIIGKKTGAAGIIRCRSSEGGVFVYCSLYDIQVVNSEGSLVSKDDLWVSHQDCSILQKSVLDLTSRWHDEIYPFDRISNEEFDSGIDLELHTSIDELIDGKKKIYDILWYRDDNYHCPSSVGGDHHNRAKFQRNFVIRRRNGGHYVVKTNPYPSHYTTAYTVDSFDNCLKITDENLEWGDQIVWPDILSNE